MTISLIIDGERCRLLPGEEIEIKKVRFRTLGCYPLTGAVESEVKTLEGILLEFINACQSERLGCMIDADSAGPMEKSRRVISDGAPQEYTTHCAGPESSQGQ